uniref:NADH dehydrogenase [ubiquinone] 1 beta subcomplex subunit 10-B n=1 Tax=Hordeum vulgare subsp. vulgare TaxID=112509 RepID=M0Z0W7_HORVV
MGRVATVSGKPSVRLTLSIHSPIPTTRSTPGKERREERGRRRRRSRRRPEMVRKAKVEFDERPPDDFDPKNPYGDPVAMLEYREHLVREKWIQIETAKIIRDRLRWCYRIEGVNHHQKCRHLVDQYLESTRGVGWGKDHRPADLHEPKKVVEVEE